jgi:outer membrane protein W
MRNDRNDISTRTRLLPLVLGAALCASASAQTAQSWSVAVGANNISVPGVSDPLSAPSIVDSRTKVSSNTQPIVNVAYMVTDHISVEFGLGTRTWGWV